MYRYTQIVYRCISSRNVNLFLINNRFWFFVLTGVTCPRAPLTNPKVTQTFEAEKYGQEALQFTKELVLQREVTKLIIINSPIAIYCRWKLKLSQQTKVEILLVGSMRMEKIYLYY